MANFNGAEKYHPVDGLLAERGLRSSPNTTYSGPYDYFDLDDDDLDFSYIDERIFAPHPRPLKKSDVEWLPVGALSSFAWTTKSLDICTNDKSLSNRHYIPKILTIYHAYEDPIQNIIRELSRLKPGWAGSESITPPDSVIRDMLTVSALLPSKISEPVAEADPDDGSVVLRWINEDASKSFTLTFLGKGQVGGYLSAENTTPAWRLKISDVRQIANKFTDTAVLELIAE